MSPYKPDPADAAEPQQSRPSDGYGARLADNKIVRASFLDAFTQSLDQVLARPDAVEIVRGFLDGDVRFTLSREDLRVDFLTPIVAAGGRRVVEGAPLPADVDDQADEDDDDTTPPEPGFYL